MRDKELEIFFSLHFLYIVAIPRWKTLHPPREIKCESTNKRVYRRDNKKKKWRKTAMDGKACFQLRKRIVESFEERYNQWRHVFDSGQQRNNISITRDHFV